MASTLTPCDALLMVVEAEWRRLTPAEKVRARKKNDTTMQQPDRSWYGIVMKPSLVPAEEPAAAEESVSPPSAEPEEETEKEEEETTDGSFRPHGPSEGPHASRDRLPWSAEEAKYVWKWREVVPVRDRKPFKVFEHEIGRTDQSCRLKVFAMRKKRKQRKARAAARARRAGSPSA